MKIYHATISTYLFVFTINKRLHCNWDFKVLNTIYCKTRKKTTTKYCWVPHCFGYGNKKQIYYIAEYDKIPLWMSDIYSITTQRKAAKNIQNIDLYKS